MRSIVHFLFYKQLSKFFSNDQFLLGHRKLLLSRRKQSWAPQLTPPWPELIFGVLPFQHRGSGTCFCHTRLHLGFSSKLKIQQVPACKMEPQSGIIIVRNQLSARPAGLPTTQPPQCLRSSISALTDQILTKLQIQIFVTQLCGVPTLSLNIWPGFSNWNVRCPLDQFLHYPISSVVSLAQLIYPGVALPAQLVYLILLIENLV